MTHLLADKNRLLKKFKNKFIYLFLDYDGTLAPIVDTPEKAVLSNDAKGALRRLSGMPDCKIAIVSGRALSDIKDRIGLKNIVYVGNHGFEIEGPKLKFKSPVPPRYRNILEQIRNKLVKELSAIKGVFIEDKGFSLSVHYRQVDKKYISKVKNIVYGAILLYEVRENAKVKDGKMVVEIRPPIEWGKGKVVLWLLARQKFELSGKKQKILPVYIGDDTTDEDAFKALKDKGLAIFVGHPKKSEDTYYLNDTNEVGEFLHIVLEEISSTKLGKIDER